MKGPASAELKTEELQSLTFLGLLADDVSLATMHYPSMTDIEVRAVTELAKWIEPATSTDRRPSPIRRRKSMGDPTAILQQAADLSRSSNQTASTVSALDVLRVPLQKVVERTAEPTDLDLVRTFAEVLARVTLDLTERLASEKGAHDWMPTASASYIAS